MKVILLLISSALFAVTTIDLDTVISGQDPGGTWTNGDCLGGNLNTIPIVGSVADFAGEPCGVYYFNYFINSANGACLDCNEAIVTWNDNQPELTSSCVDNCWSFTETGTHCDVIVSETWTYDNGNGPFTYVEGNDICGDCNTTNTQNPVTTNSSHSIVTTTTESPAGVYNISWTWTISSGNATSINADYTSTVNGDIFYLTTATGGVACPPVGSFLIEWWKDGMTSFSVSTTGGSATIDTNIEPSLCEGQGILNPVETILSLMAANSPYTCTSSADYVTGTITIDTDPPADIDIVYEVDYQTCPTEDIDWSIDPPPGESEILCDCYEITDNNTMTVIESDVSGCPVALTAVINFCLDGSFTQPNISSNQVCDWEISLDAGVTYPFSSPSTITATLNFTTAQMSSGDIRLKLSNVSGCETIYTISSPTGNCTSISLSLVSQIPC